MKKLFILIVNIVIAFPVFSCWGPAYTQEEHKHYLIPNLFVTHDCRYSLVATTNNLYNDIDYNIYDFDFEQLENKLLDLGIKQNTIELMNSKIVASVNSYQDGICIVFDEEYKHSKVKIYDVNINNFYPSDIVDEFIKLNQLELLNYLMYRHIILFDAKYYVFNDYNGSFFDSRYLSKEVKNRLRDLIEYQIVSTHKDLKDDYVMLLLDMNLFDANYEQVVVDYMYNLDNNIDLNVIAHSHFSGAVVKTYAVASSFNFMEYRDNNELSVYLFSKLFDHPKLYRQVLSEISFVVNDKENFDWEKCFSYCQTQEERDRINLAKVSLFSGINISLFEYFKDKTTNDSKLFELALIQYLQRVERHLLSPLCVANSFHKEYKKSSDFVNKHVLADAIDLEDYLNKIDIQNKVLLHMLRGYLAFMLGDFVKANKEYNFSSKHILTADYLSNQQKYGYRKQLEGLLILVDYHEDYSNQEYAALNTRLKKFLKETYRTEEMESYFELGLTNAVKQKDFATAFCFASSSGYHLEILLDIFMDYSDLDQLLLLIDENKLPFGERHPDFLRFAVIEQIGTKYFRDDNFIQAKKYFDMLPDYVLDEGRGGVGYFNRIPYSYNYHNIRVDYSRGQDTIVKTYNKRTVLNRVIELKSDISHYKLQLNNRSLSQHIILELRKKLSDSYFDLACIYSNPFWGYNRFWGGSLNFGIGYSFMAPFDILDTLFFQQKIDTFLLKYGDLYRSSEYLKESISFEDDPELLAELNFKLYNKLNYPYATSFHKSIFNTNLSSYTYYDKISSLRYKNYVRKKEQDQDRVLIALLLDSLYKHTNYYQDIILDCSDFKKTKKKKEKKEEIREKEKTGFLGVDYKIISLLFLIVALGLFVYIQILRSPFVDN